MTGSSLVVSPTSLSAFCNALNTTFGRYKAHELYLNRDLRCLERHCRARCGMMAALPHDRQRGAVKFDA